MHVQYFPDAVIPVVGINVGFVSHDSAVSIATEIRSVRWLHKRDENVARLRCLQQLAVVDFADISVLDDECFARKRFAK